MSHRTVDVGRAALQVPEPVSLPGALVETAPAPSAAPTAPAAAFRRGAGLLTLTSLLVGAANYLYSLSLAWLLPAVQYSVFATGQALLLVSGTVAGASVPWVLSREIARAPGDEAARRAAVSFAVVVSTALGLCAAAATAVVARHVVHGTDLLVLLAATVAVFLASTAPGYVQGFQRFAVLAGLRVAEVAVRLGCGLGLVLAGVGAAGALAGFGAGALAVTVAGLGLLARDLRPRLAGLRSGGMWREGAGLAAIQGSVAVLASLDVVLASALVGPGPGLASYQVATVLGRIPLFLAGALSLVVFPRLVAGGQPAEIGRSAADVLVRLVVPITIAVATLPTVLVTLLVPVEYSEVPALLPYVAATGAFIGVVNLATTFFQAERRYAACLAVLAGGVVVQVVLVTVGERVGGLAGLGLGAAVGAASVALGLVALASHVWPGIFRVGPALLLALLLAAPLLALASRPVLWTAYTGVLVAAGAWSGLLRSAGDRGAGAAPSTAPTRPGSATQASASGPADAAPRRLRVLHLAFEDHRRPGSGGGAARTREIDRRLAARHDITVVTTRYPGSRPRAEDGVRYVHIGLPLGYFGSILTYFAALPLALWRHRSDLVVEDFAAPFGGALVPWLTRRPTVGMVQWLFAREKSRQYRLPFFLVESLAVRSHRRLIAVSSDLGDQLQARNPRARVDVVPNGVEPAAFLARGRRTGDVLFLGRLEIEQKGLDLLLEAFAEVATRTDADFVLVGDGPDADEVRRLVDERGLSGRVRFTGRVDGESKFDLLASAQLVCMPSRYETFGMVAAEALACGTPVLAFDIPCLREVVPAECGVLVPAFDVAAYAGQLAALLADPDRCHRMGERGREHARRYDWDALAVEQERIYLDLTTGGQRRP